MIQNAAVKYIFALKGKERFQSMRPYLKNLHFLPVVQRIKFEVALLVFKCINNTAPTYLTKLITIWQISVHTVRADTDYFLLNYPATPRCVKTSGAFAHPAPCVWNALPMTIRSIPVITAFKTALKTHLFECEFSD